MKKCLILGFVAMSIFLTVNLVGLKLASDIPPEPLSVIYHNTI